MTVGLVAVMFAAVALVAVGAFVAVWKRDLTAALAGIPLMFSGAGVAFAGVSRFAATDPVTLVGQEMAALLGVVALALVALGIGIAGREGSR